jgi:hypothetical protein
MNKQPTLENRIVSMLNSAEATSTDIETLLAEIDDAISAADAAINKTREAALDPTQMPDANKARAAVEDVIFATQRLRAVQPKLAQKLEAVPAQARSEFAAL